MLPNSNWLYLPSGFFPNSSVASWWKEYTPHKEPKGWVERCSHAFNCSSLPNLDKYYSFAMFLLVI